MGTHVCLFVCYDGPGFWSAEEFLCVNVQHTAWVLYCD